MSFAFTAAGSQAEVTEQLKKTAVTTGPDDFNAFAADLRDLLARYVAADKPGAWRDHSVVYVIEASGHSGGATPLSAQLTIKAIYVPAVTGDDG